MADFTEQTFRLPKSDEYPSFSLTVSFSGLPISSANTGSQFSLQTTTILDALDEAGANNAEKTAEAVLDAKTGPLKCHTDSVTSVAFSPDGKKIVSNVDDKTLRIRDAKTGSSVLSPLLGHTDLVRSVAFSPDGHRLVSGSDDNTRHVWDAQAGLTITGPLLGHTDSVTLVALSSDGKKVVLDSDDNIWRVWDAETGSNTIDPLLSHTDWVHQRCLNNHGNPLQKQHECTGDMHGQRAVDIDLDTLMSVAPVHNEIPGMQLCSDQGVWLNVSQAALDHAITKEQNIREALRSLFTAVDAAYLIQVEFNEETIRCTCTLIRSEDATISPPLL